MRQKDDKRVRASTSDKTNVATKAFWKKEPPAPPPPPPPEPKGFAKLFRKKAREQPTQQREVRDVEYVPQETMTDAYARVRKQVPLARFPNPDTRFLSPLVEYGQTV